MIDSKLLDILACPACHDDLEFDTKKNLLVCVGCARSFEVKNNIPVAIYEGDPLEESNSH